ncbi:MAG: S-adenosylmethionine:tRNA ribosyltransferase-isomerase, partial [Verrucomicrobia bacterium]|nr:S-adenosylmethionine:tRNA ribosyltransferase-isomerase [Verrucomicrobiota bacterium]
MKTADFDFDLPPELIAQEPLAERDQSRMMVVDRAAGTIAHQQVLALPDYVQAGDLMVVNDTRVIPARLTGSWQDTVGKIEILLVEDLGESCWSVMIKSGRPVKAGMQLQLGDGRLRGTVSAAYPGGRAEITFASSGSFEVALQELGTPPVPPYIRRPADRPDLLRLDHERYQTLYATTPGAVAAPTAGLHLSERLLARLEAKTVARARVTLHVGPGTFKPVKTDAITDHVMESERYRVPA